MEGTSIEVLSKDSRIWEYLCLWYPFTQAEHVVGPYKTILAAILADGICFEEFRQRYKFAPRHSTEHMCFADKMAGLIALTLVKEFGLCPQCGMQDFDLLPSAERHDVQSILCRSCGT
jgi:hypothetical protein